MSQRITPTIQTELRNPHLRKVEFVRIDFPSGVVRAHSRIGDLQWTHPVHGAETYTGVGDVGAVSALDEKQGFEDQPATTNLTGLNPTLLTSIMTEDYHGRPFELWMGFLTETGALIEPLFLRRDDEIDKADVERGKEFAGIQITSRSFFLGKEASKLTFDDATHQAENPGDLFFQYQAQVQDVNLRWGDRSFVPPFRPPRPNISLPFDFGF